MLIDPAPPRRAARRQRSLRHEYVEFILERIEEFKNQLSRTELLALADEAVRELEVGPDEQLVLTEVLVLEHVDGLIMRRLNLPTFRRWRDRHLRLRRAQREPTHWGLDRSSPLASLATGAPGEVALVAGAAAVPAGFYLAAHEWSVVYVDRHLASVEAAETRAAAEALSSRFQALVVNLGTWFPDVEPDLAVLDPHTLGALGRTAGRRFLDTLKERTPSGGIHVILPPDASSRDTPLSADSLRRHYRDWAVRPPAGAGERRGLVAVKP